MRRIQVKNHKLGTYELNKICLSCFDDKRFVLNDGIPTLAYFHKDLKKYILTNKKSKMYIYIYINLYKLHVHINLPRNTLF